MNVAPDAKEIASGTFADVIRATALNFPEERYRPTFIGRTTQTGIRVERHRVAGNGDGTGTKPELAERLFDATGDYAYFEQPAFDVVAMVADDAARHGHCVAGIINCLDVNDAHPAFIAALARGMHKACDAGRFPLLDGETAELGYRAPGYGQHHLNWNAVALRIIHEEKMFHPEHLRPGQPIVALRERSIRSNGLTRAREILEQAFLGMNNFQTKIDSILESTRNNVDKQFSRLDIMKILRATPLKDKIWDRIHVPWHTAFPDLTKKLTSSSIIYAPLIYEAQGGVDGAVNVPIVAAAHISGGGVPLKGKRMVEHAGVGLHLEAVFPDPEGIPELMELARRYPHPTKGILVNERSACEQWNRGVGFLCALEHRGHADDLVALAASRGFEAAVAGEIIADRKIEWRGETWTY